MSRRRLLHPGKGTSLRMTPTALLRFLPNVTIGEGGCWLWGGATDTKGYGQFWYEGKARWAHRLAFATFRGRIRNGNDIDHKCHTRNCVNPAHLRQLTRHANSVDGANHRAAMEPAPF